MCPSCFVEKGPQGVQKEIDQVHIYLPLSHSIPLKSWNHINTEIVNNLQDHQVQQSMWPNKFHH